MKRIGFLATASVVFLTSTFAPHEARAQRSSSRVTGACQAISVSVPDPPGRSDRARRRSSLEFSAAEILDLEFLVYVPSRNDLTGRAVELKLFTPKGHLYQTMKMSSDSASSSDGTSRSQRRARVQVVRATLPVAGTTIVNNSLYGRWKAEAYLEGETSPCTKARSFTIEP